MKSRPREIKTRCDLCGAPLGWFTGVCVEQDQHKWRTDEQAKQQLSRLLEIARLQEEPAHDDQK